MIVQIYEIQTPEEAQAMVDIGVDHVGTVLLTESACDDRTLKRTIETIQTAGRKSSLIPLFRDVSTIAAAIRFLNPDIIHFCESLPTNGHDRDDLLETLERQKAIRDSFPELEIMRSIPITQAGRPGQGGTLDVAAMFEPFSDWFLTDTVLSDRGEISDDAQPVNGFVGITGETCDWTVARKLVEASRIPVILAGGIGPDNASEGIARVQPAGVDSCTLTNARDAEGRPIRFKKDIQKVAALVARARETAEQ